MAKRPKSYVEQYELQRLVGAGTFGEVFRGKARGSDEPVAVKRLKPDPDDAAELVDEELKREIAMLRRCAHDKVVRLIDVLWRKKTLVFEYLPLNLDKMIRKIPRCRIKHIMKQLLLALTHCHSLGVLHADVKPDNILSDLKYEVVKLADFGLATDDTSQSPHCMYALGYRAPELVLGTFKYTVAADVWAAGCVFVELLLQERLFDVRDEKQLLQRMCDRCGVPSEESWPGLWKLPEFGKLAEVTVSDDQPDLKSQLLAGLARRRVVDYGALDLVQRMLVMNPEDRIGAGEALEHYYFSCAYK